MSRIKIINIAVIAHVDAGKSTLVDAFLAQSGIFRDNEDMTDCVMDSNDLEKERGITIYSKNCSVMHEGYKINIVDTPGHADFSSEVERIIKTVDTVILLVDSAEGPMPQTRFVLQKSLEEGLVPILLINKIDKKDARIEEVVDEVYELFMDLEANDQQLDFKILYGIARQGIVVRDPAEVAGIQIESAGKKINKRPSGQDGFNLIPLFDTIIEQVKGYPDYSDEPLRFQISSLAYDDYIGRLGIGRIDRGRIHPAETVAIVDGHGESRLEKVNQVFTYKGLKRTEADEVSCGDICLVSGIKDITIGETLCAEAHPQQMPSIRIEEPSMSMNFVVNSSPFAGREGKYVTSRHLKERLEKELEVNVGLLVEETDFTDAFKISGRGELHLSVLIEQMRREGYELAASKPQVIFKTNAGGGKEEPVEEVVIEVPEKYSGGVIAELNLRKARMENMTMKNDRVRLVYRAPTRGLLGLRTVFMNLTRGEGTMVRRFYAYEAYKGEIAERSRGAVIAQEEGMTTAYALASIAERAELFVTPGTHVYEGMIIGLNSRNEDLQVNPCRAKKASNIRAAGTDEAVKLPPHRAFTLEEALEFINEDELVEVTPSSIRIRKRILTERERRRSGK